MSPKSAVIAALALAVVGFALYLFIQVRATPAQAGATQVTQAPPPRPTPPPTTPEAKPIAKPAPTPVPGSAANEPKLGSEVDGPPPPTAPDQGQINLKLDNLMELANKAYDSQDFDQANAIASKVLTKDPNNVRMLRIIVSANCIGGDSVIAQQHYEKLPKFDREQMRARCDRYGVTFKEPAQ